MLESDIPTFATLDEAAMAHWPLAQAMSTGSSLPRREMIEQWARQDWGQDPTQRWVKAVDEGGQMVAAALWRAVLDVDEGKEDEEAVKHEVKEEVPAPVEAQGAVEKAGGEGEQGKQEEKAAPGAIGAEMKAAWLAFRAQHFPHQPYVSTSLPTLVLIDVANSCSNFLQPVSTPILPSPQQHFPT